jgi:DNA-binding transcriptional regulator YhcF (GntR family)
MSRNAQHSTKPLHARVADSLRTRIRDQYRPGDRLDPIRKLAKQIEVSEITVRTALIMLAEEGLLEMRHGSGCYVREPDVTGKHVAILVDNDILQPNASWFFLRAVQKLRLLFRENDSPCRLYIGFTQTGVISQELTCSDFFEDLRAGRIRGVVAVATWPYENMLKELRALRIPIIGQGGYGFDGFIDPDYRSLVEQGVNVLAEHGRRRLAMLAWGPYSGSEGGEVSEVGIFKALLEKVAVHGVSFLADPPATCGTV